MAFSYHAGGGKVKAATRLLTIIYRVLTERREYIPEIRKQSAA